MKHKFLLIFILISAGILRVVYGLYSATGITSSVAGWGLMAKHIAEGRYFPVWAYGTTSLGSLFSYLVALFSPIFGGNRMCLSFVELIFSILFVISAYLVGRTLFDSARGAILSAAIVCFAPSVLMKSATFPTGVYNILLFVGNILIFLTLKICYGKRLYLFIVFGFLAGIAFWMHISSLCFIIPCILFILFNPPEVVKIKKIFVLILFFFIGSSLFWWFNFQNSFITFKSAVLIPPRDILYNCVDILNIECSFLLGALYFSGFIYLCYKLKGRLLSSRYTLISLLVIVTVALTSKVSFKPALYFHPSILVFLGFPYILTFSLLEILKRRRFVFIIAFLFIIFSQLLDSSLVAVGERRENIINNRAVDSLIEQLREKDIHYLYASYELVPIINYLTKEDIIAAFYDVSPYPFYTASVDVSTQPAVVFPLDKSINFIKNLKYISKSYKKRIIDQYVLFYSIRPSFRKRIEIDPKIWVGESNYTSEEAGLAFDRDVTTRWTTHERQIPHMCFQLDLGKETTIDKVVIFLDEYIDDRALGLKIEVSCDKVNWEEVACLENNWDILFWSGPRMFMKNYADRQEYYFDPIKTRYIKLSQTGYIFKRPNYWSMVELFVYGPVGFPVGEGEALNYDVAGLGSYIGEKRFNNIYTDYWLSINLLSGEKLSYLASPGTPTGLLRCAKSLLRGRTAVRRTDEAIPYGDCGKPVSTISTRLLRPFGARNDGYYVPLSHVSGKIDLSANPVIIVDRNVDIEGDFDKYGISYLKEVVGDFYVFYSLRNKNVKLSPIDEQGWQGGSNCYPYEIEKAFDDDMTTRWTSNKNQAPGFYFQVDLEEKRYISGVTLWYEGSPTDWPRGIRIEVLKEDSGWQAVGYNRDFSDSLYWSGFGILADSSKNMTYFFEPVNAKSIRLVLTGSSSGYWWSIHELDLLEEVAD